MSDSFDVRVWDDLSAELLQYLSIKDKIRLQSVSKQFQRTLFNRQHRIVIDSEYRDKRKSLFPNDVTINCKTVALILRISPNIKQIIIGCKHWLENIENMNQVLKTIVRNCDNLRDLRLYDSKTIKSSTIKSFIEKFGHQLESIRFCKMNPFVEELIHCCPNLLTINNMWFMELGDHGYINAILTMKSVRVRRLRGIYFYNSFVETYHLFCHIFSKNLSHLSVKFNTISADYELMAINKLSEFKSLKVLEVLSSRHKPIIESSDHLSKCFEPIGIHCKQLSVLKINVSERKTSTKKLMLCFNHFKNLRQLTLESVCTTNLSISLDSLQFCPKLTQLHIQYFMPNDYFFDNISKIGPNLTHFKLCANRKLTDSQLAGISKHKKLKYLTVWSSSETMNSSDLSD